MDNKDNKVVAVKVVAVKAVVRLAKVVSVVAPPWKAVASTTTACLVEPWQAAKTMRTWLNRDSVASVVPVVCTCWNQLSYPNNNKAAAKVAKAVNKAKAAKAVVVMFKPLVPERSAFNSPWSRARTWAPLSVFLTAAQCCSVV